MLNANWKSLLASNAVQVGVGKKRKADAAGLDGEVATVPVGGGGASSGSAAASSSGPAVVTPCLAIDCEFVGTGVDGSTNALARVSIVNFHGGVIYDKYVKPGEPVTDYRTAVSGIRAQHLHSKTAISFRQCQQEVSSLIGGKLLVGHAVHNDLTVLLLSHPKSLLRDTARYKGLCPDGRPRSLKKLVAEVLGKTVQQGEHDSVEDARAALALYKHVRAKWEKEIFDKQRKGKHAGTEGAAAAAGNAAAAGATGAAAAPAVGSSASSASTGAGSATISHKKKRDLDAQKAEQKAAAKVERNRRRNKMRKIEKQNR